MEMDNKKIDNLIPFFAINIKLNVVFIGAKNC